MLLTDTLLASVHHLLAFGMLALLAAEYAMLRAAPDATWMKRLSLLDGLYGASAGAMILVGIGRVKFGIKGAEYYMANPFFWAKMAVFVAVGLLSIAPTVAFLGWRRAGVIPSPDEVSGVRRWIRLELILFPAIPVLAAVMARWSHL